MQIVEFGGGTLRFLDTVPQQAPATGFIWIWLDREALETDLPALQQATQTLKREVMQVAMRPMQPWPSRR